VDVVDLIQAQDVDVFDADGQPAHDILLDSLEVARNEENNTGVEKQNKLLAKTFYKQSKNLYVTKLTKN
jgi:hypothetical protein